MANVKEHAVSAAVEDYLKTIYKLESRAGGAVTTKALARRLQVSPSSASAMLSKLDAMGLATHTHYRGVHLTDSGRRLALRVLRRHRLLELFLTETLEHTLSAELEEVIAAKLGHPVRDPHGDPIPTRDGQVLEEPTESLASLPPGAIGRLVRVSDADPQMLRYLTARGVALGDRAEVVERHPFGGPLLVRFGDQVQPIGVQLAEAMRVELQQ